MRGEGEGGRMGKHRQQLIDASLVVKYEGSCFLVVLAGHGMDRLCDNCVTFVLRLARRQHAASDGGSSESQLTRPDGVVAAAGPAAVISRLLN